VNQAIRASLEFSRLDLAPQQERQLEALGGWLEDEAIPAGAVGPGEIARVPERHLADSIVFSAAWDGPPDRCWDLGTGAGLPGLVLAIVWPRCLMTLIDRSGRKMDLVLRASRVIGLEVAAEVVDIEDLDGPLEAIVSRAAMPANRLLPHLRRLLKPGGLAVVSGSGDEVLGYEEMAVPVGILDHSARLLMMRG
jgi:16S rRNA (guanine527-N7)-methyltransferase